MTEILYAPRPSYAHRPRGAWPPSLFIIHATRGHTSLDLQDQATVRWFTAGPQNGGAPDYGGWSPTADALVSADEDRCWVFEPLMADLRRFHSAFSAGYGSLGSAFEWAADERAISIEVAQSDQEEPFSDATLRRLCSLIFKIETSLGFRVPRQHVPYWNQRRDQPVPRGFIGHDELENGRKGGKTDPGSQFPWDRFLLMASKYDEEDDMRLIALDDQQKVRLGAALGGENGVFARHFTDLVNTTPGDGYDVALAEDDTADVVVFRLPRGTVTG